MSKKPTIIYEFLYNSCIHESAYATISLHRTEEGAKKALKKHKSNLRKEFNSLYKDNPELKKHVKFGENADWAISKKELLD